MSNQVMKNQPSANSEYEKRSRRPGNNFFGYAFILILAVLSCMVIVWLKSQKSPVSRKITSSMKPLSDDSANKRLVDYSDLIHEHTNHARSQNEIALKKFEMDMNLIVKKHNSKLMTAAQRASKEAADYSSCCKIIYYLAWDKVKGKNQTEAYLNKEIKPFIDPAVRAFGKELNIASKKMDFELRKNTVLLAKDLAAFNPNSSVQKGTVDVDAMSCLNLQQSLRNLGINAAGITVSVVLDAVALCKSRLFALLWKKITTVAARMFSKQVATITGSAIVAAADGPLPLGDAIAAAGVIWTGYDIYASKKEFEREINASLHNLLDESKIRVQRQVAEHATKTLKTYSAIQGKIGSQTLEQINKENK